MVIDWRAHTKLQYNDRSENGELPCWDNWSPVAIGVEIILVPSILAREMSSIVYLDWAMQWSDNVPKHQESKVAYQDPL